MGDADGRELMAGPGAHGHEALSPDGALTAPDVCGPALRLTLLTGSFSDTQVLRAQTLALLAGRLGHVVTVVTTVTGDVIESLAGDPFARGLRQLAHSELHDVVRDQTDVLCTVKALDVSLGLGQRVARLSGTPLLADIDDPDIEVRTVSSGRTPSRNAYRMARRWRTLPAQLRLAVTAKRAVTTVSNPVLQARWGGHVVPHARVDPGFGSAHVDRGPRVAFVGTVRRHKGTELLRQAVASLAADGWRLVVTGERPADARPWESWVGPLDGKVDGARLTSEADVVVVPSEDFGYGRGQLPLKLIDAMLMGRAVVVSDVGPLPWAAGGAGTVFRAGSLTSLVDALRPLRDPEVRARHGARAREVAVRRYTVDRVAPAFQQALTEARRDRVLWS